MLSAPSLALLKMPSGRRLIPYRNVRPDLTIDELFEQTDRAVSSVARESSGLQTKATRDALYHGPGDRDLHYAIGTRHCRANSSSIPLDAPANTISPVRGGQVAALPE
jgi:hypothetical protein